MKSQDFVNKVFIPYPWPCIPFWLVHLANVYREMKNGLRKVNITVGLLDLDHNLMWVKWAH